jgi:hypothetical protein
MAANVYVPLQPNLEELDVPSDPMSALNQVMQASMQAHAKGVADMSNLLDEIQVKPAQRKQAVAEANKRVADINELSAPERATAFKKLQAENAQLTSQIQLQPQATEAQREALNANIAQGRLNTNAALSANQKAAVVANLPPEEQIDYFAKLDQQTKWAAVMGPGVPVPKDAGEAQRQIAQMTGTMAFENRMASLGFKAQNFTPEQITAAVFMGDATLYGAALKQPQEEAENLDKQQNLKDVTDVLLPNNDSIQEAVANAERLERAKASPQATPESKKAIDAELVTQDRIIKKQLAQMADQKMQVKINAMGIADGAGLFAGAVQMWDETIHSNILNPNQRNAVATIAQRLYNGGVQAAGPILDRSARRVASMPAIRHGWGGLTPGHVFTDTHSRIAADYAKGSKGTAAPGSGTLPSGVTTPSGEVPGYDAQGRYCYWNKQTGQIRYPAAPATPPAPAAPPPVVIQRAPVTNPQVPVFNWPSP